MISYDISAIIKKAFNIELFDNITYPSVPKNATYFSHLGIPVMTPVIFQGGTYKKLNKGKIETVDLPDLRLADTTLVDFSRQKNIITTPINGGNGTVTEFWSFDDWQIKIYGIILPTNDSVETQLKSLLEYENLADAIKIKWGVESGIFELLNIHQIEIISIDLPQMKGQSNVRPFTLICKSTEPLELTI